MVVNTVDHGSGFVPNSSPFWGMSCPGLAIQSCRVGLLVTDTRSTSRFLQASPEFTRTTCRSISHLSHDTDDDTEDSSVAHEDRFHA